MARIAAKTPLLTGRGNACNIGMRVKAQTTPDAMECIMKIQTVNVTPEMAAEWLKRNGKNRRFSQRHAEKIATSIKRGEWVLNGETICFDDNGRLLDGQHRLNAIILADRGAIPMAVAIGVSDARAFMTYDSVQRTRGAAQIAEMNGVKQATRVAAAARLLWIWESAESMERMQRMIYTGQIEATPQQLAEMAYAIEPEYVDVQDMIGYSFCRQSKVGAYMIGISLILNRIDPVNTENFFRKVRTGVMEIEHDPALVYRDRILSGYGFVRTERSWKIAVIGMTIKAWNANKTGRLIHNLRFRQEGANPETLPAPIGGGKK